MDYVVLGRNVAGRWIENETDGRGMMRRNAEILTSAGAGLPLGKLMAILETGVKNEDRAAPDVEG